MIRKLLATIAVAIVLLVGLWVCVWHPPFGEDWSSIETDQKVIALSFDDGPNPPHTEDLLALLHDEDVSATFFMVGKYVEAHPEVAKRVVAAGHHVGNHGWDDTRLPLRSPAFIRDSIARTDEVLRDAGVQGPLDFRAAGLARGLQAAWILAEQGRTHYSATVAASDWTTQDADQIAETVLSSVGPGDIVVLHDGDDRTDGAYRGGTIEAAGTIIRALKRDGYRLVTVRELVKPSTTSQRTTP